MIFQKAVDIEIAQYKHGKEQDIFQRKIHMTEENQCHQRNGSGKQHSPKGKCFKIDVISVQYFFMVSVYLGGYILYFSLFYHCIIHPCIFRPVYPFKLYR